MFCNVLIFAQIFSLTFVTYFFYKYFLIQLKIEIQYLIHVFT